MKHIVYDASAETYPTALLIKAAAFNATELDKAYVQPLEAEGIDRNNLILVAAEYNSSAKAPVKFIKEQLEQLLPAFDSVGTKTIYCADANYFKVLTKSRKAEPHLGSCLQCGIDGFTHMEIVLGVNHKALIHNPKNEPKLTLSLSTLADVINGTYTGLGTDIVHTAHYPKGHDNIKAFLMNLHQHPLIVGDVETFSLRFNEAGLGTCGFSWSAHEGGAFTCDYKALSTPTADNDWGERVINSATRKLLKEFFETYQGTIVWHNAAYDLKVIIYALWMDHPQDWNGMLKGLEILTRSWHDTKIIAYLATNSTAGNELSLKELAHSFAGNWAEDVNDIRKIPCKDLLHYNLVDCLSTFWVLEKYFPIMEADNQLGLYNNLMMPSLKTIIAMELTGMPMNPDGVQQAKLILANIVEHHHNVIANTTVVQRLNLQLQKEAMDKANAKLKTKQHPLSKFANVHFNPGSPLQKQKLLFDVMKLPVLGKTKTKQPATGGDILEKLVNHTDKPEYIKVLESLVALSQADKILTSFIPAFERALDKGDGVVWLHGSFNLGGTVSGRLSSSDPNLQNLPSGSTFGKLIKGCFMAPKGWIFCGADFASLEDRINALLTKDPNKLKVYTDGFDGHALRTFSYWPDQFPGLDPTDPASINTIKKDANGNEHPLRGKSKGPTFALTYLGTWVTLVKNAGFSDEEAKAIEANFHLLYGVSMEWVQSRIEQAAKDGYSTAAFGLRIRTPLLEKTFLGKSSTPREAEAEARTLGNAISGQSYGLLTNRAANAVMERVWASKYRFDILPVAMIHDAIYFVCKDDADTVAWLNEVLIEEMSWQELSEIKHDSVKLGANLDLFWPSWANAIELPNHATADEIYDLCAVAQAKLKEKEAA
jgi:DNA polymerase-1